MLSNISRTYWLITTFKKSPEHSPKSLLIMIILATFFWLLIGMQWLTGDVIASKNITDGLLAGGLYIFVSACYTYLLVKALNFSNRFIQTITSIYAAHIIIHLLALPLVLVSPWILAGHLPNAVMLITGICYLLFTLSLTTWQLLVTAHIYKHALSIKFLSAMLASFGLIACNILVVSLWK